MQCFVRVSASNFHVPTAKNCGTTYIEPSETLPVFWLAQLA